MKILSVRLPKSKVREFNIFCDTMEIKIISSWVEDELFEDYWHAEIKIYSSPEMPEELKEEKLNEKYSKYIKA